MARAGRKDRGLVSKADAAGRMVWSVRLWHEGKERRFGSFPTKTKAREFYEKAKLEQKDGRFFPERYQHGGYELLEVTIHRYLTSASTKKTYRDDVYFATWWTTHLHGKRLNMIRPQLLEEARQRLLQTVTPQRVNRYMAWLRHVLNLAVRDGRLSSNPVTKLTMYKEPRGKTRFLSPEEEAKLMKALGPRYASWARLALLTGLRQLEQFSLRWHYIDLEGGLITLPDTKAGEVQYVPLNEEAKTILRGWQIAQMEAGGCSPWVFPSDRGDTHVNPTNFYHRVWMPSVKRASIAWCTWHDLRHTFASRLAMSGKSDGTIASLLRHSTTTLVKRYAHRSPSYLKDAIEAVSSFGKAETQRQQGQDGQVPACSSIAEPTVTGTGTAEISDHQEKPK